MLITIDPGACTGWALWGNDGVLRSCGLFEAGGDPAPVSLEGKYWSVCIEYPVIYPRSTARPADLLALAKIAAQYGGAYTQLGAFVSYVEPATWKGQLKKQISHSRVWAASSRDEQITIMNSLSLSNAQMSDIAEARGVRPKKWENALDAVGIGQWVRSRLAVPVSNAGSLPNLSHARAGEPRDNVPLTRRLPGSPSK